MNVNPWKDPLYRLIDEYGGLAIPKGEREEWREVIPLGLRRKYRDARQPDAFVQACLEDGRCQEYGIRDTRDLHDALTIRLPTHRMGAGLRLQTEADVGDDEAEESPAWRRIREMSTVVGAEVPRGRPHRVTVYETSPVLWQRSEQSRSRRAGVAVNPMHPGEMARAYRGYWLYSDITGRLWFAKKHNTVVATGTSLEQVRAAVDSIFGFKANYPPGWGSRSVASARRRSALRQAEAFRTRDIVPGLLPTRIPAKIEQDPDPLKGFRQPEPEKQMRMFNAKTGPYAYQCKLHGYQHPYKVCPRCRAQFCSKYWTACPRCSAGKVKSNPAAQHSPVWRKGFTAGIAAKARGAVRGNPMSRVRTETVARQIAAERGVSYGLSVIDGLYYVGTPKELAAVGAIKRNPLTRRETAALERYYGAVTREWRGSDSETQPALHYGMYGRRKTLGAVIRKYGAKPRRKRNPLTRGETAEVLRQGRAALRGGRKAKSKVLKADRFGAADAFFQVAKHWGASKKRHTVPMVNPRIVGRAGKGPVFNGTRTQALAYARAHGLGTPYQVGIQKGARV